MTAALPLPGPRRPLEAARLDRVSEDVLLPVSVLGGAEPPAGFRLHQGGGIQRGAGDRGLAAHVRHPQDQQGECLRAGPCPKLREPRLQSPRPQQTMRRTQRRTHRKTDTGTTPPTDRWTQGPSHTRVVAHPTRKRAPPGCRGRGSVWAGARPEERFGESVLKGQASLTRPPPGGAKGSGCSDPGLDF